MKTRTPFLVGLLLFSTQAMADERVDEAVRLSKLTLSAFRCSILTNKEAETNRLFEVGYKSGQSFLDIFDKLNDEQRKLASPNLAILWRWVAGPTKDFVLGMAYQNVVGDVGHLYDSDQQKWTRNKQEAFSSENCMVIR